MDINTKFNVSVEGNEIIVTQTIIKRMDIKESLVEMAKLKQDILQIEKQRDEFNTILENDQIAKDLVKVKAEHKKFKQLEKEWQNANLSEEELILNDIRAKVKTAKAERGYSRCKGDRKLVMANGIIGPIAAEYNLDATHPLIQRLRQEFDNI